MLSARADLKLEGPGLAVHVRGDGAVLIADVSGGFRGISRAFRSLPRVVRFARAASRALRGAGMRVDCRIGGRTFAKLG